MFDSKILLLKTTAIESDEEVKAAAIELVRKLNDDAGYVLKRMLDDPNNLGPQLATYVREEDKKNQPDADCLAACCCVGYTTHPPTPK